MADTPGVAARLFGSLSKAGINVRAIAQGSSERNISLVVDRADSTRALRAVHAGFYLSDQVISVGVVGAGLVGRALLAQLEAQAPRLRARFKVDLRVRAIASSTRMLLGDPSLTAGIPGEGDLTDEEIQLWLDNPARHETLEVELPLGLSGAQQQIKGLDKNPLTTPVDAVRDIWPHLLAGFSLMLMAVTSAHIVMRKKDTRAAIGWIGAVDGRWR